MLGESNGGNLVKYVKPVYKGSIKSDIYNNFLQGIYVPEPQKYQFIPLPSEDYLEKQILEKYIKKWNMHNCSLCGYECGFIFDISNDKVLVRYDNGCYCMSSVPKKSSLSKIIEHMEIQTNLKVINEYKSFWSLNT